MKRPSDIFGIGPALEAALNIYFSCARGTGRTTRLVGLVKSGDRVIFANSQEARRLEVQYRGKGLDVKIAVVDPARPDAIFEMRPVEGRTWFDHTWIEQFYAAEFARMGQQIHAWQVRMSGVNPIDAGRRPTWTPDYSSISPLYVVGMLSGRNDIARALDDGPQNFEDKKP